MTQWIIVIIIIVITLIWIARKLICGKNNGKCTNCNSSLCPLKKTDNQ